MKKKHLALIVMLFITLFSNAQSKVDTLTNAKIIQLTKIGLQPSVIVNKINSSVNLFDVSTDGLIKLSENNVATEVMNEMMKYDNHQQASIANQKDMKDPLSMRPLGIYYYDKNDAEKPIKRIDPSVSSSAHSGGGSFYGIGGSKELSNISGENSQTQIAETSPVLYFYFEKNGRPGSDDWWFATATSPKEFVLVKLDVSKKARTFQIGGSTTVMGFGGENAGIPEKMKLPFEYTEIADGIYKVTFKQPLKTGEYCFVYASSTPDMFSNNKVFDFGIPKIVTPK